MFMKSPNPMFLLVIFFIILFSRKSFIIRPTFLPHSPLNSLPIKSRGPIGKQRRKPIMPFSLPIPIDMTWAAVAAPHPLPCPFQFLRQYLCFSVLMLIFILIFIHSNELQNQKQHQGWKEVPAENWREVSISFHSYWYHQNI